MAATPSTALDVLYRALSLANVRDTASITYQSRTAAMQEAMRKLYTRMMAASDHFYTKETQISLTSAMLAPNNDGQGDEYIVPLPSDFYRVLFVSWLDGGTWRDVDRFPISMRNLKPDVPYYDPRDNNLWVIGCGGQAAPTLRIGYYPPAPVLTFPDVQVIFGSAYNPATVWNVSSPCYAPLVPGTMQSVSTQGNPALGTMLYVYNNTALVSDSKDLGSQVTLYTGGSAISNVLYYRGYIYFLMGGAIYRQQTDLLTPFTMPTQIVASGGAFSFVGSKIYYVAGGSTYKANLDGSSPTVFIASPVTSVCLAAGQIAYLDSSGNLWWNSAQLTTIGGFISMATDGTNLFILDSTNNLNLVVLTTTAPYGITSITQLVMQDNLGSKYFSGDVSFLAPIYDQVNGRVAVLDANNVPMAVSPVANSSLSYPLGVVYEILEYDMAVVFKVQRSEDPTALNTLLQTLWKEFEDSVRRDDYQVTRINNFYARARSALR